MPPSFQPAAFQVGAFDVETEREAYLRFVSQEHADTYFVFRGTLNSGAAFVYGSRDVRHHLGLIDGRAKFGTITSGLPETVGGAPERVSTSMELENADNALTDLLIGTTNADPALEYAGDGVLNLKGKIYHGVQDPDSGTCYEQPVTPTMFCSGSVVYDGTRVSIPLASRDDEIIGRSKWSITVRQLLESRATPAGGGAALPDGSYIKKDGSTGTYPQTGSATGFDWNGTVVNYWRRNLDQKVPFAYGVCAIPLIPVSDDNNYDLFVKYVCFVSRNEPGLSTFARWEFRGKTGQDTAAVLLRSPGVTLFKIQRYVTLDDGSEVSLWVVWLSTDQVSEYNLSYLLSEPQFLIPTRALGLASGRRGTPAEIVRQIIDDHSQLGSTAISTTYFDRARDAIPRAGICGGLYYADAAISEILEHIAGAFGFSLWIDSDDLLRILVNDAFHQADLAAVAAGTFTEVYHADVFDGWREEIPRDPQQRGAPCTIVTIEWSQAQRDVWHSYELPQRTPGNTALPLGAVVEGNVSGAWVFPKLAIEALADYGSRRSFVARRVTFVSHAWLGAVSKGSLFYVTHPRGLDTDAAAGYVRRLMRLERAEVMPSEGACRIVLEDLGPVAAMKPAVLDALSYWTAWNPTPLGNAARMSLTAASSTVTLVGGATWPANVVAGQHIWTFGAPTASNRKSVRIVTITSATSATVEFNYAATETFGPSGSGIDMSWCVVDTQSSKGNAFRPDKIRLCREDTGLFRDGVTVGYRLLAG